MAFDNIKLDKGLYSTTKGFTASLEEIDPSDNYIGTELEGLDAYQRQLKRFDIKVSGKDSDCVSKFFRSTDSAALFPEYISRAVTQGMEENDVLSKMVATTTIIDSLDYRSVQLTTSAKDKELAAVGEGASIPETEIKTSDNLTRLHKRGRMLVASYEAIKYQKLDLFTLIMKQLGSHIVTSQYVDAVETILYGSTNLMDDKKTPLSYADLVEMWLELSPYKMTTVVAASNEYKTIMNMAEFKDSNAGLNFHATGKLMTPLGADLLKYDDMPEQSILVLDKNAAVEKVQAGGVVTEYDKLIDRQLERASITVTTGFSLMDQNATLSCRFGG